MLPNKEYLHECFMYDGGLLYWKERPESHFANKAAQKRNNKRFSGKLAGRVHSGGVYIRIGELRLLDVKIKWIMFKEEPLPEFVGFKDLDSTNRTVENLLAVSFNEQKFVKRQLPSTGCRHLYKNKCGYTVWFWKESYIKCFKLFEEALAHLIQKKLEFGYRL